MGDSVTKLASLVPREMTDSGIPERDGSTYVGSKENRITLNKSKVKRTVPRMGVVCRDTGLRTFRNLLR